MQIHLTTARILSLKGRVKLLSLQFVFVAVSLELVYVAVIKGKPHYGNVVPKADILDVI